MNQWLIGGQGDRIVFLRALPQSFSRYEAYNLAAWLVAMAGNDQDWFRDELQRILRNEDTITEEPPAPVSDKLPNGGVVVNVHLGWDFNVALERIIDAMPLAREQRTPLDRMEQGIKIILNHFVARVEQEIRAVALSQSQRGG